jgi:predicted cobalt transporter CbtA
VVHFWWIMTVIMSSIALGAFVHPLALPAPLLVWLIVEFIQAGRRAREQEDE